MHCIHSKPPAGTRDGTLCVFRTRREVRTNVVLFETVAVIRNVADHEYTYE